MRDHGFGVWVARSMLLNSAGVENMISKLQEISAGRAYVQVVGRGDSQYSSGILPWAEELDGPFDGLSKTIETARGSGLKISAWMNVNLVWKFGDRPSSKDHVVNSNPEWITCDERGLSMLEYSSCDIEEVFGPFIDPGIPQVRRFTARSPMSWPLTMLKRYTWTSSDTLSGPSVTHRRPFTNTGDGCGPQTLKIRKRTSTDSE